MSVILRVAAEIAAATDHTGGKMPLAWYVSPDDYSAIGTASKGPLYPGVEGPAERIAGVSVYPHKTLRGGMWAERRSFAEPVPDFGYIIDDELRRFISDANQGPFARYHHAAGDGVPLDDCGAVLALMTPKGEEEWLRSAFKDALGREILPLPKDQLIEAHPVDKNHLNRIMDELRRIVRGT